MSELIEKKKKFSFTRKPDIEDNGIFVIGAVDCFEENTDTRIKYNNDITAVEEDCM